VLYALDRWRLALFKTALGSRALSPLVVRRDSRLALMSGLHALVAGLLAVYFPVLLFVLAPVLLGVVHVAADVRYLVLRRRLAGWWRSTVVVACVALFALQGLALLHAVGRVENVELGLVSLWALLGVAGAAYESKAWRRAGVGLLLVLLLAAAALAFPRGFRQAFAHAHNLVVLFVWPLFFRRRPNALVALRVPIALLALLLASGALYRASLASPGAAWGRVHVLDLARALSPFERADLAIGLTSAFVFLQAVHYAIWLSVIPQAEQPGEGPLSFRQTARSLVADFGGAGLGFVALAAAAVLLAALRDPWRASTSYLSLALFHGYLELVLLLYFWIAGIRLSGRVEAAGAAR
jgi:hypothetical protein